MSRRSESSDSVDMAMLDVDLSSIPLPTDGYFPRMIRRDEVYRDLVCDKCGDTVTYGVLHPEGRFVCQWCDQIIRAVHKIVERRHNARKGATS